MTRTRILVLLMTTVLVVGAAVVFAENLRDLRALLTGYQEVPTLSTSGQARFEARIGKDGTAVDWQLSYENLESAVTQSHIHFGARAINGPVIVFLCSNLGNGPAGTQPCPAAPATISGTFVAADVTAGGAAQGLEAGNLDELIAAIRTGATYANVHTTGRPGGEIRGQISAHDHRHLHD
jgi:CHRD domain-containing protein